MTRPKEMDEPLTDDDIRRLQVYRRMHHYAEITSTPGVMTKALATAEALERVAKENNALRDERDEARAKYAAALTSLSDLSGAVLDCESIVSLACEECACEGSNEVCGVLGLAEEVAAKVRP